MTSNALVQLQARYYYCGEAASEECLPAATFVRPQGRETSAHREPRSSRGACTTELTGSIGPPDTIVTGFPDNGGHSSRSLAFDHTGNLFVNIGSDTNACWAAGHGMDPCPELDERAGIWRFDPTRLPRSPGTGHPTDCCFIEARSSRRGIAMESSSPFTGRGTEMARRTATRLSSSRSRTEPLATVAKLSPTVLPDDARIPAAPGIDQSDSQKGPMDRSTSRTISAGGFGESSTSERTNAAVLTAG